MRKLAALAGIAALGLSSQGFAYDATAVVTFTFGGNSDDGSGNAGTGTWVSTGDLGWTSNGTNTLASAPANSTYFTAQDGYNSVTYYNQDFFGVACSSYVAGWVNSKYGCRTTTSTFYGSTITGTGPLPQATGTLTVTDTTLTGTLTVISTTDVATGTATTISPTGVRLAPYLASGTIDNKGTDGFNIRSADGSPFGNYWQGVTTAATLEVALTGVFGSGGWNVTGGTVKFTDPGFVCQQGGFGSTSDPAAGTLCTGGTAAGSQQPNAAHLSWGWDVDGVQTGTSAITQIDVRDAAGSSSIASLSGVLAALSLTPTGNALEFDLATTTGEFRRALGSSGGGCADHIRYNGTKIACGTLTTGLLDISGTVTEIPLPAAAWLVAPAILAAGRYARRRRKAA